MKFYSAYAKEQNILTLKIDEKIITMPYPGQGFYKLGGCDNVKQYK